MSAPTPLAPGSAAGAEKSASPAPTAKLRSCVVCRSRKVRCDKLSPCSNCRRANIPCVVPSNDRPPKWARRLERVADAAAATERGLPAEGTEQVMERLRSLESLVRDLSGQLERAKAASSDGQSPEKAGSPSSTASDVQRNFGRMVLKDASRGRYIASGFWSRISDELDGLKMDTRQLPGDDDSSQDEDLPASTPSTQELDRPPPDRHAFLFRHNLSSTQDFRPLPAQIPFLLDVFNDNINFFAHVIHMPTIRKMIRPTRGSAPVLSPANDALMFSIYYAAVTSMEEDEVLSNFGSTKADLNLRYRLGLEHALAKADFLNDPDIVIVQAFAIFLLLVRRHDSPRYVWMMTGLLIRMAKAIGLHRDGSRFEHLSPFQVEQRRRLWWMVCVIDVRASEDQGTEFTITRDSFDTRLPLNINVEDLDPGTKEMPPERDTFTEMSAAIAMFEISDSTKEMVASTITGGGLGLEEQTRLLNNLSEKLERGYFQYSAEPGDIVHWVGVTVTRLVLSKMTLLIYLPALFASPNERFSDEIRDKLLVAAIEVAEYNHALNSEQDARQWRWIYQTYTHWYAIVYLFLEICRRPWSAVVERAWIALHSPWLIPSQHHMSRNLRVWVPLRKLMGKARRHREMELERVRGDPAAIGELEESGRGVPAPASSGPFPGNSEEVFLEHWRRLVSGSQQDEEVGAFQAGGLPQVNLVSMVSQGVEWSATGFESVQGPAVPLATTASGDVTGPTTVPQEWTSGPSGFSPWSWTDNDGNFADVDVNMEVDGNVDWNTWLQSATGMELNMG
ncbi:hypothetical protein ACJ41O_001322 [Fusarium nematophilum]